MQLGLRHVGGNETLYLQLLRRFVRDFAGFATRVESMLAAESWDAAVREVHTFKGLSATFGASELQLLAAGLEKALASRSLHGALEKLAATGIAFEAMAAALNAKFATDDARVVALTSDQWFARLRLLLREKDDHAREFWQSGLSQIDTLLAAEVVAQISRAIANNQFDDALDMLPKPPASTDC